MNMSVGNSSVKKGETLIDTAMTLNAMRADVLVIRHMSSGAVRLIADKVDCPVLNAGDGQHGQARQGEVGPQPRCRQGSGDPVSAKARHL